MDRDSSDAVGAHKVHLLGLGIGAALGCSDCHTVPATAGAAGHLDSTPGAELVFSDKAKDSTNVPGRTYYTSSLPTNVPNPRFVTVPGTNKKGCADSYCHGSFKNGNSDNIAVWSAGEDGAKCGSCHGDVATGNPLPKTAANGGNHPSLQDCSICHSDVVSVSGTTYTIIDKQKHINGKLNVYGTEVDY
jgi:predicted CxxxxCH...CXXCH cytochrome family protein